MAVDIAIQTDAIKCRGNFLWWFCYSISMRVWLVCFLQFFFLHILIVVIVVGCKSIIWRSIKFHTFSLVSLVVCISCIKSIACVCWVCRMSIAIHQSKSRFATVKIKTDPKLVQLISFPLYWNWQRNQRNRFPLMQFNILLCLTILIW